MDLLFRDRESLGALCDALARQRLPLDLPRVPEESAVGAELRRAFRGRGYVHIAKASPYPTMRIDASWREPESHFNAGRRSDFRRAQRAAERHGAVQFEIVTPTAENLDALLAEAYQVELQSWKGRAGTALAVDQLRAPVYRQYFRMACERGILRIVLMRIDGRAVGMQLVTETNQRLWLMKIGHDEQYSKASPGTLLMLELARYAAARDIQSIEFLGSAESWTQLWSEELRQCVRIRAFPVGVTSGLAFIDDAAQSAWTSLRRKFNRANP
jgi:CelD/BcsL family acetyltransferase involved in cellulose biosynthesis